MQYLLLLYGDEGQAAKMQPEDMGKIMGAYVAYTDALAASGGLLGSNALHPSPSATTVRGDSVLDGPFAETKEQLGGYYLIDVPDLDAAVEWAKRCPAADGGAVEVRPVMLFSTEQIESARPKA
jgi:hypothetical protein